MNTFALNFKCEKTDRENTSSPTLLTRQRKHIVAYVSFLLCFFNEGKSCDYSDVLVLLMCIEKTYHRLSFFLTLCFFIEGNPITVLRYLVFAISVN